MEEKRGIDPAKWGACAWSTIHYVALGYPKKPTAEHQRQYAAFFESLKYVLPCLKCRENFTRHMTHASPATALAQGQEALFDWTVRLHNIVNGELGMRRIDVRAARAMYRSGAYNKKDRLATALLVLALAMVVASMFCRKGTNSKM